MSRRTFTKEYCVNNFHKEEISADGKYLICRHWDETDQQEYEYRYEIGSSVLSFELIAFMQESKHQEELNDRYARENAWEHLDSLKLYGDEQLPLYEVVPDKGPSVEDILFGDQLPDKTEYIRELVLECCNEKEIELFYSHFGEGDTLEEVRQREIAKTKKNITPAAMSNRKSQLIRKVADRLGVEPVKRKNKKNEE